MALDSAVRDPQAPRRPVLLCRVSRDAAERDHHLVIRHRVFVTEQQIFAEHDRDVHDDDRRTRHILGLVDGAPAGAVRIFPLDGPPDGPDGPDGERLWKGEQLWKGDRLAVLPEFRRTGIGPALVRHAVRTAGEAGGTRMLAWIQLPNTTLFARLGWTAIGEPAPYLGQPHQQVAIALSGASR